jgi:hypothetical protein
MEREEFLKGLGIEPYKGSYDDILMKGIPKPKKDKPKPEKVKKKPLIDMGQEAHNYNKKNKYGSAGLGGLDKDGLGDALFNTMEQLFK